MMFNKLSPLSISFIWIGFGLFALLTLEISNIDLYIQDYMFLADRGDWIISKNTHPIIHEIFYYKLKWTCIIFIIICASMLISSYFNRMVAKFRGDFIIIVLSAILISCISGVIRYTTNMTCPHQCTRYNGDLDCIRPIEKIAMMSKNKEFPKRVHRSCFPSGHASAGFSILGLIYTIRLRISRLTIRVLLYTMVMLPGLGAGFYQISRGMHYTSDIVSTMFISLAVVNITIFCYTCLSKRDSIKT